AGGASAVTWASYEHRVPGSDLVAPMRPGRPAAPGPVGDRARGGPPACPARVVAPAPVPAGPRRRLPALPAGDPVRRRRARSRRRGHLPPLAPLGPPLRLTPR